MQAVVRLAGEFDVPVWPVSTGKNWGYGEKSACYPGGITMVLERMTRIWHVDEELAYAVVEPGVTYKQLNDYLKENHPSLWADVAGTTQYASVIGNALDKGRGLTPYADHFNAMCGMDVVLADGSLLQTGGGPVDGNQCRHVYKWGLGPYLDGVFAQSNLGIVVKSGVWLMPAPESFDWAVFEYTGAVGQFPQLIDDLRRLVFAGAVRARPHIANDFAMMCIVSQYPYAALDGKRCLSDEAMASWRKKHGVARWTFGCGLYGTAAEVRFQRRYLRRVLGRYGRVQFLGVAAEDTLLGRLARKVAPFINRMMGKSDAFMEALVPGINLFKGIPTDHFARQVYFKSHQEKPRQNIDPARDQCGFLWIGPVVPFTSGHVMAALKLAKEIFDRHEFDMFVELIVEGPRSMIMLLGVFYERNDPDDAARARGWYEETRFSFIAKGYPPYRTTTMSMPGSSDINPVSRDFLAAIKRAVDTQNLIAPGRYGTPGRGGRAAE
ncbi:MAG: FAD-dependent oxidoreductase [Candidatus Accumulibacter sp.]|nr:FAD-dependent oxidoreductase [Accumulibacter sp.]